jgi:hypothetical protein
MPRERVAMIDRLRRKVECAENQLRIRNMEHVIESYLVSRSGTYILRGTRGSITDIILDGKKKVNRWEQHTDLSRYTRIPRDLWIAFLRGYKSNYRMDDYDDYVFRAVSSDVKAAFNLGREYRNKVSR